MARDLTKIRHKSPFRQIGKFLKLTKNHYLLGLLSIIIFVLCFLNYQPGTFLTGWDNLHPEYNLPANLGRAIFSVWQEYQSLGLLAGMAHAADLPRQLFFLIISQFHPSLSLYRYLWTFLMLFLGPIGTYFLLYRSFLRRHFDHDTNHFASFLGGLFYLLNLSTLQQFFTPFETFIAFYGFLPWLLYFLISYLEHPKTSNLLRLFIISFIATPSFVTETLFVVFGFSLLCFFTKTIHDHKFKSLPQLFLASIIILISNSFWLLPNIFFVLTNGSVGLNAKMNLMATPETYYRNLEYGNLGSLAILKGFWFSFLDLAGGNKFDYLMTPWRSHTANPTILFVGFLSFALVITGIVYSLKKKIPYAKSFLSILLICFFFLLGGGLLINSKIPLIGELFRSPFTKFSIPLSLTYSIFFSIGCIFLLDLFSFLHSRLTHFLTLFTVALGLIIFMTPAFTGYLISPTMRLRVPKEYFDLFDYFKTVDPAKRIANFPQQTFWGWNYYDWGYRGSGFLWYGIKQPILDRAFDVWERSSEKYYEEINAALYSEDQSRFENLISKYAINYILIDDHVISPGNSNELFTRQLKTMLDKSDKFTLTKNYAGKLLVYETKEKNETKNFLSTSPIGNKTAHPFENQTLRPQPLDLTDDGSMLVNASPINFSGQLTIPNYLQSEKLVPTSISYKKTATGLTLKFEPIFPSIILNGEVQNLTTFPTYLDFPLSSAQSGFILAVNDQYFEIQLPEELPTQSTFYPVTTSYLPGNLRLRVSLYSNTPQYSLDLSSAFAKANPTQCFTNKPNRKIEKITTQDTISLFGTDVVGCLSVPIPQPNDLNLLISLGLTYSSPTNTQANASISTLNLSGLNTTQPLISKKDPTFTRIYAKPVFQPLQVNLILEANETKSTQEIDYQNVQVSYLPLLNEADIFLNGNSAQNLSVKPNDRLSISIPIIDSQLTINTNPDHNLLAPEAINCDNFNGTKFEKENTTDGIIFTSVNANSCDNLNLRHLPHSTSYVIILDQKSLEGLPSTYCLENFSTKRCDVFERADAKLNKQYFYQPIVNENESAGYSLHIFNQSFGQIPTRNQVRSITVSPYPLNFLKDISIGGDNKNFQNSPVTDSTHPAEFIYLANIKNQFSQNLNLYQTKSPYWKAMEVSENDFNLPLWLLIAKLPHLYFFGNKQSLLNHSEVDWFNSWTLPSGNHHFVIFYLPQYLEFLGFILLPFPIIVIFLVSVIKLIKPKKNK